MTKRTRNSDLHPGSKPNIDTSSTASGNRRTRSVYTRLEKLGRVRLSQNFYFRQFLYSEIAVAYGIANIPDNEELAIEAGTNLCELVLEPIVKEFGPVIIRSGFRSATLNAFGHQRKLNCASNERNYAAHIWDNLDAQGRMGASACIVIPAFNDGRAKYQGWDELSEHLQTTLPCTKPKRFKHDNAFNIGWRNKRGN
jgi:hypothetical protein